MINYLIPLLGSFMPIWSNYLIPVLALGLVATIPCVIRSVILRR